MRQSAAILAASGLLAACTAATGPQTVSRLGADPMLSGGSYDSGGGITVAVELQEHQGRVAVCGVWAQSTQQSVLTSGRARGVLDTGSVAVGGTTLVRGLRYMTEVPPMQAYGGQEARCLLTEHPWPGEAAARRVETRLPRQVVYVDGDEEGGTIVVRFKPTGPGAE